MANQSNCEYCINYVYDEEFDCYTCLVDLDQDEMHQFMSYATYNCTHYRHGDEYTIVRKQI